jgi:DNA-binding Lrp family transcriptional regulator
VTDGPLLLNELDREILGQIYPSGRITIAGVDPRVSVSRMSRTLRTSRGRIAARLRAWQRAGMLLGYDVWPNPGVFGLAGLSVDLRVKDPLAKAELWRRVGLVDGAVQGLEFLGEWVSVQLVAPDPGTLRRRVRLLAQIEGVAEVGAAIEWPAFETRRPLSPLDLRIVRALREAPTASLATIAHRAGVSARTMTDRYARLLDEQAVWFVPMYDFTRLASPVIGVTVNLANPNSHAEIARAMRPRLPSFLVFDWVGSRPAGGERLLGVIVLGDSAASVEEVQRAAAATAGVTGSEANVLVRVLSFPETFDALLEAATRAVARSGGRRTSRAAGRSPAARGRARAADRPPPPTRGRAAGAPS